MLESAHIPVMPREVREVFAVSPGHVLDATGGAGGHTAILLELGHSVTTFDRDPEAIAYLKSRFAGAGAGKLRVANEPFSQMAQYGPFDGVLADLGFSSRQLAQEDRGFSFRASGPLDMRMNPADGITAAALVESSAPKELAEIFWKFGEEKAAFKIARRIAGRVFVSAKELGDEIEKIVGPPRARRLIHPATRVFQALRIAVNDELGELERFLADLPESIRPGGRVAVISFHSLEDRLVKTAFQTWTGRCTCPPGLPICSCGVKSLGRPLWSGVKRAENSEVNENPRARSAKMRAFCFL